MRMRFFWLTAVIAVLAVGTGKVDASLAFPTTPDVATPTPTPTPTPSPTPAPVPAPTPEATPASLLRTSGPKVVPYEKLLPFLPQPPAGWTAEKPSGSTNDIEVFSLSTVAKTYQKGDNDDAPVATVTIIDAGGHKGYFEVTTGHWKITRESLEGYDKAVEIGGMPGYEHYNKQTNTGSLCVIVGNRFFVQVELTNDEPAEMRKWLERVDLKKLAELK